MKQADLNKLKSAPPVAWPTVMLFILCTSILGLVWYACIQKTLPLWIGMLINGITAYFLFSVVHDSSHNAVSRNRFLNEALGRIGLIYFAPLAPMDVARYIHMSHHKHTNDPERDPDAFGHKLDWLFPLRWLNFDYYYAKWFFQKGGDFARRKYTAVALYAAFICSAF
jgi:beta-carotene hydroxylase